MKIKSTITAVVGAVLMAVAGSASAAATYCSAPGAHPEGLTESGVTYSVTGVAPFVNSNDCYGVVAGNVNAAADIQGVWGTSWQNAAGTDTGSDTATLFGGGFTFTLTGPSTASSTGVWTLTATDNTVGPPDFPLTLDFVVALKAGAEYALYFLDDVTFDGSGGGTWSIQFTNNGSQIPNLSHLQIFVREGTATTTTSTTTTSGPGTSTTSGSAPEPASGSLALLGLGLLGVGYVARRRNQA